LVRQVAASEKIYTAIGNDTAFEKKTLLLGTVLAEIRIRPNGLQDLEGVSGHQPF